MHVGEAGTLERFAREAEPDPVKRRVHDLEGLLLGLADPERAERFGEVALEPRGDLEPFETLVVAGLAPRHTRCIADLFDRGGDGCVVRSHELHGVVEVHLVAVVFARIVARRHDDSGRGAERACGVRDERRGDRLGKEAHGEPRGPEHGDRVAGELRARGARVVPHDDR